MAGDWIKMSHSLRTHPKVVTLASRLQCDRLKIIGALFVIWSVTDTHSEDGFLDGFTLQSMDDELRFPGFCEALVGVGWLDTHATGGIQVPDFQEHMGKSAKKRLGDAERKRKQRDKERDTSQKSHKRVTKKSRKKRDQRREEKSISSLGANAPSVPMVLEGGSVNQPQTSNEAPPTSAVWKAYASAYESRYGVPPVRNAKVSGQLAQFILRVPASEAPAIAAWYLRSDRGLYTSARHAVDLLLRDAEALRTDWATGTQRSDTEARRADRRQATGNAVNELIEEARRGDK